MTKMTFQTATSFGENDGTTTLTAGCLVKVAGPVAFVQVKAVGATAVPMTGAGRPRVAYDQWDRYDRHQQNPRCKPKTPWGWRYLDPQKASKHQTSGGIWRSGELLVIIPFSSPRQLVSRRGCAEWRGLGPPGVKCLWGYHWTSCRENVEVYVYTFIHK